MSLPAITRIRILRNQIALLEDNPKNTIGGRVAFFSGNRTFLKQSTVDKIAHLNSRIDKLQAYLEDDDE